MRNVSALMVLISVMLTQLSCSGTKTEEKPKDPDQTEKRGAQSGPGNSGSSQKQPFELGFETTRIMEPQLADGRIDYVSDLNGSAPEDVASSNNAAVDYWMALGSEPFAGSEADAYFELLGVSTPPLRGPYFRSFEEYVELDPRVLKDEAALQSKLAMLRGARLYPWSEADYPDVAKWLGTSRTPMEHLRTGTSKSRMYLPIQPLGQNELLAGQSKPSLPRSLDLADALLARAMLRAEEVGVLGAWEDLDRCYKLAEQILSGSNSRTDLLAGLQILSVTLDSEVSVAQFVPLTASQAKKRATRLRASLDLLKQTPSRVQQFERYRLLDLLAWVAMYRDDDANTAARQVVTLSPLAFLLEKAEPVDWSAAMSHSNELVDRLEQIENSATGAVSQELDAFAKSLDASLKMLGRELTVQPFGENPAASAFQTLTDEKERGHLVALELVRESLAVAQAISQKKNEVRTRFNEALLTLGLSAARQTGKADVVDLPNVGAEFIPESWTKQTTSFQPIGDGYVFRSPANSLGSRWICNRHALLDAVEQWKPLMEQVSFSQQFGGYVDGIDLRKSTNVGELLQSLAYLTLVPEPQLRLAAEHVQTPLLSALVTAKSVDLRGTDLAQADLDNLSRLQRLAELRLDRTGVGDDQMERIASIKTLENLTLSGVPLTDKGLEKLSSLSGMNYLNVRETKVTAEGVSKMKRALPQCQIDH